MNIKEVVIVKEKEEFSTRHLLECSICGDICKRAVITRCCQASACRACAIKKITTRRTCWVGVCGREGVATKELDNDDVMRQAVEQYKNMGRVEQGYVEELGGRLSKISKEKQRLGKGMREEVDEKINETKTSEERRGRAKSVPRERSNPIGRGRERTMSIGRDKNRSLSRSSERVEEGTFFGKMSDRERDKFAREKMARRQPIYGRYDDSPSPHHRYKSKSRSRSPDSDTRIPVSYSLGYWCKEKKIQSSNSREDRTSKASDDHIKEKPCKFFNETGYCRYIDGHPDQSGNANLHICATCYENDGVKRHHSQMSCKPCNQDIRSRETRDCKEEPCIFFNKFGDCPYESGHRSHDGNYLRLHICKTCFNKRDKKRFHPATDCRYGESKRITEELPRRDRFTSPKDRISSPRRVRSSPSRRDGMSNEEPDEKPCTYFNNHGDCQRSSGHLSRFGHTKQLHICSCCLEFRREVNHHSALNCKLKKKLTGDWKDLSFKTKDTKVKLPCQRYNNGRCLFTSGHGTHSFHGLTNDGSTKMVHICKFCFEYRGEENFHGEKDCKLKYKLIKEVENESLIENSVKKIHCIKKEGAGESNKKKTREERRQVEYESHFGKHIERLYGKEKKGDGETIKNKRKEEVRENKIFTKKGESYPHSVKLHHLNEITKDEKETRPKGKKREHVEKEDTKTDDLTPSKLNRLEIKLEETFFNSKLFMQLEDTSAPKVKPSTVGENPLRDVLIKNSNRNSVDNAINQSESNVNKITNNSNQFYEKNDSNVKGIVTHDMNLVDWCVSETLPDYTAVKIALNNNSSTLIKNEEQDNGVKQIENLPTINTSKNDYENYNHQLLNSKARNVKKRRKLERFNPDAIIHIDDAKTPSPHPSIRYDEDKDLTEAEKPLSRDLLLLDKVQVEEIDPNSEINKNKIMEKIEILEKLHAIEIKKLRKAQQQIKEKQTDNRKDETIDQLFNGLRDTFK